MKYRKKPVVVDAIQLHKNNLEAVTNFFGGEAFRNIYFAINYDIGNVRIVTLEGVMNAVPGDWIIRGVMGEFYSCKPDVFELSYEKEHAHGG